MEENPEIDWTEFARAVPETAQEPTPAQVAEAELIEQMHQA